MTTTPARRVFVTGAAGFIGTAVCRALVEAGHEVIGYDDLSRGRRDLLPPEAALITGDIRDRTAVAAALGQARPHWVIHLAAMHFIPDCLARPDEARAVNVGGTAALLDACRRMPGVQRVIFASTAAVYAPSNEPCVEDRTPVAPIEVYGETKLEGERLSAAFHADTGISTAVLRLFNAVGRHETNPHVIPHIFESLRRSNTVPLGNVEPRRDYIDTRDLAAAMLAAASGPAGLQTFNVGTGRAHSVADVIDALRVLLGRDITVAQDVERLRPTDRPLLVADIRRIRQATGWAPAITFEQTLADLIDAYGLSSDENFSG